MNRIDVTDNESISEDQLYNIIEDVKGEYPEVTDFNILSVRHGTINVDLELDLRVIREENYCDHDGLFVTHELFSKFTNSRDTVLCLNDLSEDDLNLLEEELSLLDIDEENLLDIIIDNLPGDVSEYISDLYIKTITFIGDKDE